MPNWCYNTLVLKHENSVLIDEVVSAFENGELFNYFLPLPDGKWNYNWCVENWGTKWDVEGGDIGDLDRIDGNTVELVFDSAWSPPKGVYQKMVQDGYQVIARYHEPGLCFVGKFAFTDEEEIDESYEYSDETHDTVRDLIGDDLDDHFNISILLEEESETFNEEEEEEFFDYKLPPHTD